jgi:hypothetical protein
MASGGKVARRQLSAAAASASSASLPAEANPAITNDSDSDSDNEAAAPGAPSQSVPLQPEPLQPEPIWLEVNPYPLPPTLDLEAPTLFLPRHDPTYLQLGKAQASEYAVLYSTAHFVFEAASSLSRLSTVKDVAALHADVDAISTYLRDCFAVAAQRLDFYRIAHEEGLSVAATLYDSATAPSRRPEVVSSSLRQELTKYQERLARAKVAQQVRTSSSPRATPSYSGASASASASSATPKHRDAARGPPETRRASAPAPDSTVKSAASKSEPSRERSRSRPAAPH